MKTVIGWWSGGVTSAVALKMVMQTGQDVLPIFFETGSHHPDTERFRLDCERWYGQKILTVRNKKYDDVLDLVRKRRFLNGPGGALCTAELKKKLRIDLEKMVDYSAQIFGFHYEPRELKRAENFTLEYPSALAIYPLIDSKFTKQDCINALEMAGIEVPIPYKQGFKNSNCIGCLKGGQGYWAKVKKLYPDIFWATAKAEEEIGRSCIKGVFLKDLPDGAGRYESELDIECGIYCPTEGPKEE